MKCILPVFFSLFGLNAANHVVVSLGSSYSAGAGLKQSYGSILADLLQQSDGAATTYVQGAVSGSLLTDVPNQAKKILKNTTIVTLSSGGNDVNYVQCLSNPSKAGCDAPTINATTWTGRFNKALDSIISNLQSAGVASPTSIPIYVATFPEALGPDTKCSSTNANCTLTPTQFQNSQNTFTDFTNWTISAFNAYKSSHSSFNLRLVDIRPLSVKHDVGSQVPWINGKQSQASTFNGDAWHPTKAGVNFIASAILANDLNKPSPTPKI